MMNRTTAFLLGCLAWVLASCATTGTGGTTDRTGTGTGGPITTTQAEREFVENAASGGQLRLQLSELAQQKTSNLEVREFARLLAKQQTTTRSELRDIAQQLRITYPTELKQAHKAVYDRVAGLSGSDFDRSYVREVEQSFLQDISVYQNAGSATTNFALRGHILKTTPIMQGQLRLATQLKNILP
ncbi:DUF4142 domain-containing protein [Rufibacter psychrotolerans]|uniref:DUF4142 domain-containing protein n=1 Tax=Rufibacter psychrotolerans TaxID=2812556 RepID=UPI0019683347|nr:DUF4142 domain-containing protein [Rufibacter sp. SYSU D00308]